MPNALPLSRERRSGRYQIRLTCPRRSSAAIAQDGAAILQSTTTRKLIVSNPPGWRSQPSINKKQGRTTVVQLRGNERESLNIRIGEVTFPLSNLGCGPDDLFTGGAGLYGSDDPDQQAVFFLRAVLFI